MNRSILFLATVLVATPWLTSCYTSANIERLERREDPSGPITYRYRVSGLQQMMISIVPDAGFLQPRNMPESLSGDWFYEEQLAKLRVYIEPLSGTILAKGLEYPKGEGREIKLNWSPTSRTITDHLTGESVQLPQVMEKFIPNTRFVSIERGAPKCDFILTIVDPEGFTRKTGLKIQGGFQDSL